MLRNIDENDGALKIIKNLLVVEKYENDSNLWHWQGQIFLKYEEEEFLIEASNSFQKAIECCDESTLESFYCQQYACFLLNHLRSNLGDIVEYLERALKICETESIRGKDSILNVYAQYKIKRNEFSEAKKLYKKSMNYCCNYKGKGFISPHTWIGYAKLLINYYGYLQMPHKQCFREAERYCIKVIEAETIGTNEKKHAYHTLGLLVGSKAYINDKDAKRPNFQEAINFLEYAFDSPDADRINPEKKTFQDIITHKALKDVYLNWAMDKGLKEEANKNDLIKQKLSGALNSNKNMYDAVTYLEKAQVHFENTILGLPRYDLKGPHIIKHMLEAKSHFQRFFKDWKDYKNAYEWAKDLSNDLLDKYKPNDWDAYKLYMNPADTLVHLLTSKKFNEEIERSLILRLYKHSHYLISERIKSEKELTMKELKKDLSKIESQIGDNLRYIILENIKPETKKKDVEKEMTKATEFLISALKIDPINKVGVDKLSKIYYGGIYKINKIYSPDRTEKVIQAFLNQVDVISKHKSENNILMKALKGLVDTGDILYLYDDNHLCINDDLFKKIEDRANNNGSIKIALQEALSKLSENRILRDIQPPFELTEKLNDYLHQK